MTYRCICSRLYCIFILNTRDSADNLLMTVLNELKIRAKLSILALSLLYIEYIVLVILYIKNYNFHFQP